MFGDPSRRGRVINQCPSSRNSQPQRQVAAISKRYALRDGQWERLKDFLPGQAGRPGATAKDNWLFVDAVLYRYRAGIPWRDLPSRFGDFRVVHTRHSRWNQSGAWQLVFDALAQDADN